ncbi:MAG TPA: PEP-CTERM-box response regulator transcription factor [Stellaceae bacterium]|jgi:two-component system, NtrC family, response regulator|nr:PEP-CTERM-box response regulator transcription factor [Stellaceae bacterium]
MKDTKLSILVVEDDDGLIRQYRWALADCEVVVASNRENAIAEFRRVRPPVVILDLGLPPEPETVREGMITLEAILAAVPGTKIIVATGQENHEAALRAVALGAYDFYEKPVDVDLLRHMVERAAKLADLESENRRLLELAPRSPIDGIVAASPQMARALRAIEKIAPTDVAVLLLGESGTGKEVLAQAIHRLSPRAKKPFVAINCAAIPETLLESELFGHEKGAFTGAVKQTIGKIESASGGTLFLDEIGDVPLAMQVKLLRFLQDQVVERIGGHRPIQVDVRIICATNQNLDELMANGKFREDLYYRLNEVRMVVPPLREREGDAILLATFFLKKFNAQFNRKLKGFGSDALAAIATHPWRGNVRELENRVKRAVVMADGAAISAADLELAAAELPDGSLDLREARARAERGVVQMALAQTNGNLSRASKLLGISRPTLYGLLEGLGLEAAS